MKKLLERAREKGTPATQQTVIEEGAGTVDPAVDGTTVGGDEGATGGGDPAAPKEKFCWNCQAPGHTVELQKCRGCKRVRYTTHFLSKNLIKFLLM